MTRSFIKAIHSGDLAAVIAALEAGADIEAADAHGYPGLALRTACFHGHLGIVFELLKRGANVRAVSYEGAGAAVRAAVRGRRPDIVRLLLEHGADLPHGVNVGLSHEEIFQAQLMATITQRNSPATAVEQACLAPDQEVRELFVSAEEIERLFGRLPAGTLFA